MDKIFRALCLFLIFIISVVSCSKSSSSPGGTSGSIDTTRNPNPPVSVIDPSKVVGWWGRYQNGALNTPPNAGYSRLYFGADSFYLQDGLAGDWFITHDSIHIDTIISSKLTYKIVSPDTLLTFTAGSYSQTYVRINLPFITSARIETVAGGAPGYNFGDGGSAKAAYVNAPSQLGIDGQGNIYVAVHENVIRKITLATGIIDRVAGVYSFGGYSGDGGPALSANMYTPAGLVVNAGGDIFLTDYNNNCIRKVNASDGKINVIGGTPATAGGFSGDGGPAINALFSGPTAIALDGTGNIYIADKGNHRVRKISAANGTVTTVAGNGANGVTGDGGSALAASITLDAMTVDAQGNIYIVDGGRIRKITAANGLINTIAGSDTKAYSGDGLDANSAQFTGISCIALDHTGNIYVAQRSSTYSVDPDIECIRKISVSDGKVYTVAGEGTRGYSGDGRHATGYMLYGPSALVSDANGNIFIADMNNNRVRKLYAN